MPIKPENRKRYPADWPEVRVRIMQRAHFRCEWDGCAIPHRAEGYWRRDRWVRMPRSLREAGYKVGDTVACSDGSQLKVIRIILTIAHLGLPAHLPVHLHMARSAQADEVIEVVGFLVPFKPEQPEWTHMMHVRALAEFGRGPTAMPTSFVVALPSGFSCSGPRRSVPHEAFAVAPEYAVLTGWSLLREPLEAARVAAKAAAGPEVVPADLERLTAAFAEVLAEPAFRSAQCFVATGLRTGLDGIRGLLRRDRKDLLADDAWLLALTSARGATNPRSLDANADARTVFSAALERAGLLRPLGVVRETERAGRAGHDRGALSGSSHTGMLLHFDEYPENCADENLRAWCQRHHLRYDAKHHAETAYATRRARANTHELF